ncbi:MAG: aconitase X [Candidatus Competibacterales bacterium]
MTLTLTPEERDLQRGGAGEAVRFALSIIVSYAEAVGARGLIPISRGHVDGCLYHGRAGLDFVERLCTWGGRVAVPTTLNVGSIDLIHPGRVKPKAAADDPRRRLMERHLALGCEPTFTCAPYFTRHRPRFGEQIAWGESNAIVFANSVIGARTNRYGDFIDLCCAMAGRAPAYGLHLDQHRLGEVLFQVDPAAVDAFALDALCVGLGYLIGSEVGNRVPVIQGLPACSEDQLKALGAVAASSGSVALFHVSGVTPEAPDTAAAFAGGPVPVATVVGVEAIRGALNKLSTVPPETPLQAVSLGTPHYSLAQLHQLDAATGGWRPAPGVACYVNVGRDTLATATDQGVAQRLTQAGIQLVADTCTYVTTIIDPKAQVVMTDSGKLAHYAPGNLDVEIAFGTQADCLASAAVGKVVRVAI